MALFDFVEKIGKLITTTITLSEDVKRCEGNIKDFQQQLRDNARILDSYKAVTQNNLSNFQVTATIPLW
jgi:hypothetical protein